MPNKYNLDTLDDVVRVHTETAAGGYIRPEDLKEARAAAHTALDAKLAEDRVMPRSEVDTLYRTTVLRTPNPALPKAKVAGV